MKTHKYQPRTYRNRTEAKGLYKSHIALQETDLCILSDRPLQRDYLLGYLRACRGAIEDYISKDPRFLTALKPLPIDLRAPAIVREMGRAGLKAGVGPLAAVAGAIAQSLGRQLLRRGCREVIIENGGDIFMVARRPRSVGLYAGTSCCWKGLRLKIAPQDTPLGICTSSGTVGHSLSFGSADSVTILSHSASLADAVATATANRAKDTSSLKEAIDFARSIRGVLGVVILIKRTLTSWGRIEFCA